MYCLHGYAFQINHLIINMTRETCSLFKSQFDNWWLQKGDLLTLNLIIYLTSI